MNELLWSTKVLPSGCSKPQVILLNPPSRNLEYPPASLAVLSANLVKVGVPHCVLDANVLLKDYLLSYEVLTELIDGEFPRLGLMYSSYPELLDRICNSRMQLRQMAHHNELVEVQETKYVFQSRKYINILESNSAFSRLSTFQSVIRIVHFYVELAIWMMLCRYPNSWNGPVCRFLNSMIHVIQDVSPFSVAITAMSPQRNAALLISRMLKSSVGCITIVGGADPSRFPTGYLQHKDYIDYVYAGRVSEIAIELLSPHSRFAKGLWTHEQTNHNQLLAAKEYGAKVVPEPLTFDSFPLNRYLFPVLPVATSRGCSWRQCDFCDHWHDNPEPVMYDPEAVAEQMKHFVERYGITLFHLTDDELEPSHGCRVFKSLSSILPTARVLTYARPSRNFTRDILELWFTGGVRVIEWGLESASDSLLRKMRKGIDVSHVSCLLRESAEIGIINKLMMFHNHPFETEDDLRASLDFLTELLEYRVIRPFFPIRTRLELRRNTVLYSRALNERLFHKVWWPNSGLEIAALYADDNEMYATKVRMIDEFCEKASRVMYERRILHTDDENIFLDLVIVRLREMGHRICLNLV